MVIKRASRYFQYAPDPLIAISAATVRFERLTIQMNTMQAVAHHLQIYAHGLIGPERDAFARSAYNRYYYACFLSLRAAFAEMNTQWKNAPHRSYPEILSRSIAQKLHAERRKANKNRDYELLNLIFTAHRAIPEISKIIKEAYATRIVADYEPDILVDFKGGDRFSLNEVQITNAHEWYQRVSILTESLLAAWRQINA